jgi:hypothetical protein
MTGVRWASILLVALGGCAGSERTMSRQEAGAVDPPDSMAPSNVSKPGPVSAPAAQQNQERPPDPAGGQSGDPGNGEPWTCYGERWDGPDTPWIRASCHGGEGWTCICGEQDPAMPEPPFGIGLYGPAVAQETCREALLRDCDIDADAALFCSMPELGICWPAQDETWICDCGSGFSYNGTRSQACDSALWAQCGNRCESAFGTCGEVNPNAYRCMCTGADEPLPVPAVGTLPMSQPRTCPVALAEYCGERCESSAGSCEPTQDGFLCSCEAGIGGTRTFQELGGISPVACGNALQAICGAELLPPMTTCVDPESRARCEGSARVWPPGAPRPESFEYRCQCAEAGAAVTVEAKTCHRAMIATCPEAIDLDAVLEPAAPQQVGAVCTVPGDCAGGICQLGRLRREGVCSAPCTTDGDCSAGAICAFAAAKATGRCFMECEREYACDLLNDAFDDPLACGGAVDLPYGRLLRDDESGNLCVPISDVYWPLPVRR